MAERRVEVLDRRHLRGRRRVLRRGRRRPGGRRAEDADGDGRHGARNMPCMPCSRDRVRRCRPSRPILAKSRFITVHAIDRGPSRSMGSIGVHRDPSRPASVRDRTGIGPPRRHGERRSCPQLPRRGLVHHSGNEPLRERVMSSCARSPFTKWRLPSGAVLGARSRASLLALLAARRWRPPRRSPMAAGRPRSPR